MSKSTKNVLFNRNNLIAVLVGLAVALTALAFLYVDNLSYQSDSLPASGALEEIVTGQEYRQRFVCTKDGLSDIEILTATYARANSGNMTFTLEDEAGNDIQSWTLNQATLPDNAYVDLALDNTITDSNGKVYFINIVTDSIPGSSATIYTTNYGGSSNLSRNGEELGISVCFRLEYSLPASSLLSAKNILISLMILILFPLLMAVAIRFFPIEKIYILAFPEIVGVIGFHRLLRHTSMFSFPHELMAGAFFGFCILWTIAAIVTYRLIFIKGISVQKFAVIILTVFSLMTIGFLTPGTGNDEQVHFAYAYKYANVFSFKGFADPVDQDGDRIIYMRAEDAELLKSMVNVPIFLSEGAYKDTIKNFSLVSSDNTLYEYKIRDLTAFGGFVSNNAPLGYVASGLGIAIARLLHLGTLPTFYMGRIFNAALFILLVYLAIRIIPVGKETLLVISVFPMVLQQCVTYSYDSILIGAMFLFAAIIVSILKSDKKITLKQYVVLGVLAVTIAISKFVYAPLILVLLAIPSSKFKVKNANALKAAVIAAITICGAIVFAVLQSKLNVLQYFIPSSASEDTSLFVNVVHYMEMLYMTFVESTDFFIHSMIAYPGWYQIHVPVIVVSAYYLLLIFSLVRKKNEERFIGTGIKVWTVFLILASFVLITLPMAAKFTNPGSDSVDSLQGRYFLPFIPLIALGIRMKNVTSDDTIGGKVMFGSCYMSFIFFAFCILRIFVAI